MADGIACLAERCAEEHIFVTILLKPLVERVLFEYFTSEECVAYFEVLPGVAAAVVGTLQFAGVPLVGVTELPLGPVMTR